MFHHQELRFEDYGANRKSKQAAPATGGLFGSTPAAAPQSGGGFTFGGGANTMGQTGTTTGFGGGHFVYNTLCFCTFLASEKLFC